MKKIYISGPISGLPLETVYNNFTNAEVQLLEQGYEPVNPLNNGLPTNATWEEHMRADLRLLLDCDAIYMLEGWEKSRGARIEHDLGIDIGLGVYGFGVYPNEKYSEKYIKELRDRLIACEKSTPRYNRNCLKGNYTSPYFPVEIEKKEGKLKSFLSYLFNR